MKKILIAGILFASLIFGGCKKVIEETPYSFLTRETFPTNASEADIALFGIYGVMQHNDLFAMYHSYLLNMQDDLLKSVYPFGSFNSPTWDTQEHFSYIGLWKGVNAANSLIATLESFNAGEKPWATAKLAEARANRAFFYFQLVRLWGDLPLRMKPTVETSLVTPRSPAQAIYDSIILPDLAFADNKLTNVSNGGGRFTNGAVKALLADVFITLAGNRRSSQGQMVKGDPKYFAMARDKAKEVIDMEAQGIYGLEPRYDKLFTDLSTDVYNKEIIMDVEFTKGHGSNFGYFFGVPPQGASGGGGGNYFTTRVKWVATLDKKDTRYSWNVGEYYYAGWNRVPEADINKWGPTKFQKIYPATSYWADYNTNWPLYRLADVKLLYAEAANEANGGPTADAYKQVNAIRYRARPEDHKTDGTVLPDIAPGLNQAQFRDIIMAERGIELILEGKRRFDLIRWGNLVQKVVANSNANEITQTGEILNRFYLFSLPPQDLLANSWTQNAGY